MRVELLTAGYWHDSIGDIALTQSTLEELARRDVCVLPTLAPSGEVPCVVGGGALLTGDTNGIWADALRPYHTQGRHALNGAAIAQGGDFSYLKEYCYVSVRDQPSFDRIKEWRPDARLVPCVSVLSQPPDLDYLRHMPTYGFLNRALNNPYSVVDARMSKDVEIEGNVIRVDTRPWGLAEKETTYKHRNPVTTLAVLAGAQTAYCATLHLSIMAMAVGTPFACYEPHFGKIRAYWQRANYTDTITKTPEEIRRPIDMNRFIEVREQEQRAAKEHLDLMVAALKGV